MDSFFDHIAAEYDAAFTHTEIGLKQRAMVYSSLEKKLPLWNRIFEVNCGTGEDAIWFGQKGKSVLATDISKEMVKTAAAKLNQVVGNLVEFRQLDVNHVSKLEIQEKYDLIFSNFGGLNCLNHEELKTFLHNSKKTILTKTGSIVLVLMSKGSIWESLFYLRKLNFKKAFRRNTNNALEVNVNGTKVPTYYYNPSFFKALNRDFQIETIQTVGFFLPPSYLEPIFKNKPKLLRFLLALEKRFRKISMLASFSDHYLIELKPR
jgi:SAM-dependent methyltransferase